MSGATIPNEEFEAAFTALMAQIENDDRMRRGSRLTEQLRNAGSLPADLAVVDVHWLQRTFELMARVIGTIDKQLNEPRPRNENNERNE